MSETIDEAVITHLRAYVQEPMFSSKEWVLSYLLSMLCLEIHSYLIEQRLDATTFTQEQMELLAMKAIIYERVTVSIPF